MKLTRKRKATPQAWVLQRHRRARCRARMIGKYGDRVPMEMVSMTCYLREFPRKARYRIAWQSKVILGRHRHQAQLETVDAHIYWLHVGDNAGFPEIGCAYGKWLMLDAREDWIPSSIRQFSLLLTKAAGWFLAPQPELGGRVPANVVCEDGVSGAQAVGALLDAMFPEGPPMIVKSGRKKGIASERFRRKRGAEDRDASALQRPSAGYGPDDGPLSAEDLRHIREAARGILPQGRVRTVRSLPELSPPTGSTAFTTDC